MSESFLPSAPKMKGSRVLEIKNPSNPESVFSLSDDKLRRSMEAISSKTWELSREELESKIHVSQVLNRLRLRFWDTYNERISSGDKKLITHSELMAKITTYENGRNIFEDPLKMAYILCPVEEYDTMVQESLEFGLGKLRKVLANLDPVAPDGVGFRKEQASLLLRIVEFLDKRVHGTAVQRIEAKTLQLTGDINKTDEALTPAQIAEKIKNLETDLKEQHNVVEVKND
jgi:hypothetical protein